MALTYAYNAIPQFVENKVGTRIIQIYQHLATFIEETGPIIEDVYQRVQIIENLPLGKIKRNIIEDSLRNDLEEAKKSLATYNRIYGRTDLYLGLMTSNFRLPQYLQENNISPEQINYFQKELQIYWEATYGTHLDHLEKCKNALDKLRKILEQEVRYLETIPQEKYLTALEDSTKLRELFKEERETFWNLVKTAEMSPEQTNQVKSIVNAHIKKTRIQLIAFGKIVKTGTKEDIDQSRNQLEKAILILTYLIGALSIISEIPRTFKKKVLFNIFNRLSDEEKLSNTGKALLNEAIQTLAS